jgi:hypothetical protein
MFSRVRAALVAFVLAALVTACNGSRGPLGPDYEYEEDLTLSLNGSATLIVNASIPALVALRGLPLSTDLQARGDQQKKQIEELYAAPGTTIGRIATWTRRGRRFVGIHLAVADIRALPKSPPFAWASYDLHEEGEQVIFRHALSARGTAAAAAPRAGWQGDEIIAFRVHLPARIRYHNARDVNTNQPRAPARGNILTWEQRLADRLAGKPIAYAADKTPDVMEVRTDRQSILYRTLWLFGIAFLAALLSIGGLIWLAIRKGG